MTSELYRQEIEKYEKQRDAIDDTIRKIKRAWVEAHHPLQIGDIVPATEYQRGAVDIRVEVRYLQHGQGGVMEWGASGPILGGNGQRAEWVRPI